MENRRLRRRQIGFSEVPMRGLLSGSRRNLDTVDSAYYANRVYANTVDVSRSDFEHSLTWKDFQVCSCGLWGNGSENCGRSRGFHRKASPTNAVSTGRSWEPSSAARAI